MNPERFGMNVHLPHGNPRPIAACVELGVKWVRIDLNWDMLQPHQGRGYNWGAADDVVAQAHGAGLGIFATVAYAPPWATSGGDRRQAPSDGRYFHDFVAAAVQRYGERIRHWGIWNEPNLPDYYTGSMAEYVEKILVPGADAVHATNGECLVLGPELSDMGKFSSPNHWSKWMSHVFSSEAAHGQRLIDTVSHHMYKKTIKTRWYDPRPAEMWRFLDGGTVNLPVWGEGPSLKEHLATCGVSDRPLWLTETGWNAVELGEDGQSRSYESFLEGIAGRAWVEKVFFYEIQDDPNRVGVREGLTDETGRRKPAFTVLKDALQAHPPTPAPKPKSLK